MKTSKFVYSSEGTKIEREGIVRTKDKDNFGFKKKGINSKVKRISHINQEMQKWNKDITLIPGFHNGVNFSNLLFKGELNTSIKKEEHRIKLSRIFTDLFNYSRSEIYCWKTNNKKIDPICFFVWDFRKSVMGRDRKENNGKLIKYTLSYFSEINNIIKSKIYADILIHLKYSPNIKGIEIVRKCGYTKLNSMDKHLKRLLDIGLIKKTKMIYSLNGDYLDIVNSILKATKTYRTQY